MLKPILEHIIFVGVTHSPNYVVLDPNTKSYICEESFELTEKVFRLFDKSFYFFVGKCPHCNKMYISQEVK